MRRHALAVLLAVCTTLPSGAAGAQWPTCNGKAATTSSTYGTAGEDVFVGTEGNDTFYDEGGNDTICGMGGDDVLNAGLGDDFVDGGPGNDHLYGCDSSHGRSDVIICHTESDADTLIGDSGDDHLFGHIDDDSMNGGDGYDVLDGGEADDSCVSGERYARCETTDPPEPSPACMDGADNDGDTYADADDPGCARPRDPTEDVTDDPECYNGNDDDDDGSRDYPEDVGCTSFGQEDELACHGYCPIPYLDAGYDAKAEEFRGFVEERGACAERRAVLVRRVTPRGPLTVRRVSTDRRGAWRAGWTGRAGRYFAVARSFTYHTATDDPVCHRLRSRRFRIAR